MYANCVIRIHNICKKNTSGLKYFIYEIISIGTLPPKVTLLGISIYRVHIYFYYTILESHLKV